MSESMTLAGGFPAQTHEDWQRLVAGVVNKSRAEDAKLDPADAEASLRTTLAGDLVIDPLYSRPADARPLGVPGAMPFTRGRALRDPNQPWDVRQLHDDPDAARTLVRFAFCKRGSRRPARGPARRRRGQRQPRPRPDRRGGAHRGDAGPERAHRRRGSAR